MRVMPPSLTNLRRKTVRSIRRLVEPQLYDSGYRKALDPSKGILDGSRPFRLWAPKDGKSIKLGGYKLDEILGVTEDGPLTDAHAGGCVWEAYGSFPLEDLLRLEAWARKTFSDATS